MTDRQVSAIGFTVKSGWTAAVLLGGSVTAPRVIDSVRIDLSDPAVSESRQPYHAGFGAARAEGPALSKLVRDVQRFGDRAAAGFIRRCQSAGHEIVGVGVVTGSLTDPAGIANAHIRIHALEGQLFRTIVERAAAANGLTPSVWRERDLYRSAATALKRTEPRVRQTVTMLGTATAGPWRSEQKAAAVAAWLVLAARSSEPS